MYMNLKIEMRKRNLTQADLAACLGISQQDISNKILCRLPFSKQEQDKLLQELFTECEAGNLFENWNPDSSGLYHLNWRYTRRLS